MGVDTIDLVMEEDIMEDTMEDITATTGTKEDI